MSIQYKPYILSLLIYTKKFIYIQSIFNGLDDKFQIITQHVQRSDTNILQDIALKADAVKLFRTTANVLIKFDMTQTFNAGEAIDNIVAPFLMKNIDYICFYFDIFSTNIEFVTPLALIIQMGVRICGAKLEQKYTKFVDLILKVLGSSPEQNFELLETLKNLLTEFKLYDIQKEWLLNHFADFNKTLMSYLASHKNSDLIIKWIDILDIIHLFYPEFFLSIQYFDSILEFILGLFSVENDYTLVKKIALFLGALFQKKDQNYSDPILKILQPTLSTIFVKILCSDNLLVVA